jgi:mRNA interferase RelE/StbE
VSYHLRFSDAAKKQFQKLDKQTARHILDYMARVANLENPFSRGHGLTATESGFWRYRVGDWRIICRIQQNTLEILVVRLGNRREIYRAKG